MVRTRLRILLVGFGNVGREFARLLVERRGPLARNHGLEPAVVGILTARHGSVERASGINLRKAIRATEAGGSVAACGRPVADASVDAVRRIRADVVVEVTPLRIAAKQVALDHLLAALGSGKHVITANKGPVVYHYRRLAEAARKAKLGFRFEGTVMDGAPVFSLFRESMRGARIDSFEGILNSTSNLILSEIEAGRTYDEGVAAARAIGFLETEPSMDLDGWDATVKACLLGNVLMGGRLRPEEVPRQGVSHVDPASVRDARARGQRIAQVARGWRDGRRVKTAVAMEPLASDHPLFPITGTSSSLLVRTDMLKEFQIIERDPGLRQTAYALYADLLAIHEGRLTA